MIAEYAGAGWADRQREIRKRESDERDFVSESTRFTSTLILSLEKRLGNYLGLQTT